MILDIKNGKSRILHHGQGRGKGYGPLGAGPGFSRPDLPGTQIGKTKESARLEHPVKFHKRRLGGHEQGKNAFAKQGIKTRCLKREYLATGLDGPGHPVTALYLLHGAFHAIDLCPEPGTQPGYRRPQSAAHVEDTPPG